MRPESTYPESWLDIAEKDLVRAQRALRDEDAGLAGYCLQQAVEKGLKAFLLASGRPLRRIHDLGVLLDDAVEFAPALANYRDALLSITDYYTIERCPLLTVEGPSCVDVKRALDDVQGLFETVRAAVQCEDRADEG